MNDVVIASAARTAIGTFGGGLSALTGAELGEIAIREALLRAKVPGDDVDEVVLGQVLTAATGCTPQGKRRWRRVSRQHVRPEP